MIGTALLLLGYYYVWSNYDVKGIKMDFGLSLAWAISVIGIAIMEFLGRD